MLAKELDKYPNPPDPNWDYAELWELLDLLQARLQELRAETAKHEEASTHTDKALKEKFLELKKLCYSAIKMLKDE